MIAMPEFANIAIQVTNYSNELEFFGIEIDKADFAGFMIKTDPTADNPQGGGLPIGWKISGSIITIFMTRSEKGAIWDTTVLIIIPVPTATGGGGQIPCAPLGTTPAYTVISMRIRVMTTSSSIMPKMPRYTIMNSSMAVTVWRRTRHRLLPSVSVAKYTTMSYAGISALPSSACAWVMWRFSTISSLPARKSQALSIWGLPGTPAVRL